MLDTFKFSKSKLVNEFSRKKKKNSLLGRDSFCLCNLIGKCFLQIWGPYPPLSSEAAGRKFKIAKVFL